MPEIPELPSDPVRSAERLRSPQGPASAGRAGPAFEVLLERLEARAAELEERSRTLASPAELPGALEAARVSLEDALALGTELLEAYRAAQRAPEDGR